MKDEEPLNQPDQFPDMPHCYQASWKIIEIYTGWNPAKKEKNKMEEK